jgi:glycerate kinase
LPDGRYVPMTASSYGTGQLIAAALDAGARSIVLGIGGSACTDGGAGMVTALGARLRDSQGRDLPWGGASLVDLDHLDLTGLHPALAGRQEPRAELVVACDVTNPLLGATGAARVYGPQKGATPQQVTQLEQALTRWADIVELTVDGHFRDRAGAGAAGGVGFAAMALLGAQVRPGVEVILELLDFPSRLSAADLVITGEGSLDRQTLFGKGPAGVAAAAASLGIPVVAVAGSVRVSPSALSDAGFTRAYALTDLEPDLDICLTQAKSLVERTAQRVASDIAACGIRTAEGSVDT